MLYLYRFNLPVCHCSSLLSQFLWSLFSWLETKAQRLPKLPQTYRPNIKKSYYQQFNWEILEEPSWKKEERRRDERNGREKHNLQGFTDKTNNFSESTSLSPGLVTILLAIPKKIKEKLLFRMYHNSLNWWLYVFR